MDALTYPEVGATLRGDLPPGYRHLRVRAPLGAAVFDAAGFEAAAEAVSTYGMHRAAGLRVTASEPRAAVGVTVTSGVGPLRRLAPCRVVAVVDEPDRAGFAYGTLPGHVFVGEEAFVVERDPDGRVWLAVTAFSRPASVLTRPLGPLIAVAQRLFARHLGRTLRRRLGGRG